MKILNSKQIKMISGGTFYEDRICDEPWLTPTERGVCLETNIILMGMMSGVLAGGALMNYAAEHFFAQQTEMKAAAILLGAVGGGIGGTWVFHNLADNLVK